MIEEGEIKSMLEIAVKNFDAINIPDYSFKRNMKFCLQKAEIMPAYTLDVTEQEKLPRAAIKTLTIIFDKEIIEY